MPVVAWAGAPPGPNVGNPPQELALVVAGASIPSLAPIGLGVVIAGLLAVGAVAARRRAASV